MEQRECRESAVICDEREQDADASS